MIVIILPVHPEIVLLECTLPNALFVLIESSQCFSRTRPRNPSKSRCLFPEMSTCMKLYFYALTSRMYTFFLEKKNQNASLVLKLCEKILRKGNTILLTSNFLNLDLLSEYKMGHFCEFSRIKNQRLTCNFQRQIQTSQDLASSPLSDWSVC